MVQISLTASMDNQADFCFKVNKNFKIKKPKRKFVFGVAIQSDEPSNDITRDNTGIMVQWYGV